MQENHSTTPYKDKMPLLSVLLTRQLINSINAMDNGKVSTLLQGMDTEAVNKMDETGHTPLHAANLKNNSQAVTQLLAIPGINVNARNSAGMTPIMMSAAYCHIDTLRLLLDDSRVDLDAKNNHGRGLEEYVGANFSYSTLRFLLSDPDAGATKKRECLEMIKDARRRRQGQDLEDVRSNVRIQYIEQIDKVNKKIEDGEQRMRGDLELRKKKMKDLKERQVLEKRTLDMKSDQEIIKVAQKKSKLEKQLTDAQRSMAEMQQRKTRDSAEMKKRHGDEKITLEEKFKKADDEDQLYLANLKEMTNQLARDLKKLDMEPGNDASSNDHGNLEAVRGTLECPICMETMRPPTQIWMCPGSHIICASCKDQLEGKLCPTCRTERVTLRAFMAENFARTVFNE